MVFIVGVGVFFFIFIFIFMDYLELNDMTLILSVDMNARISIETYVACDKPFILTKI
jgi:hypothetical protein